MPVNAFRVPVVVVFMRALPVGNSPIQFGRYCTVAIFARLTSRYNYPLGFDSWDQQRWIRSSTSARPTAACMHAVWQAS